MVRIVAGFAGFAVAALLAVTPTLADDAAAEAAYSSYHRAIHAAVLCERRHFGQDAHKRMAVVIDEKIHYAIGAGRRLTLVEQAKSEVGRIVDRYGCDDPSIQEALTLFHAELAATLEP